MKERDKKYIAKGWGLPTWIFSAIVGYTALVETFDDFPFALVSAIGTIFTWSAVSTLIYRRQNTNSGGEGLFSKIFNSLLIWVIGAVLIRVGGMTGVTVFGFYINLTLWSSILGSTFSPSSYGSILKK
tara:strand:+ start:103 stop:486 length:384 start_codon:yes stop_codon:yes gene_type:complete